MRNSNVLAIATTATISNIMGTTPCIEPNYKYPYVKSSLHTLQASNIEKSTIDVKKEQRGVMCHPNRRHCGWHQNLHRRGKERLLHRRHAEWRVKLAN